MKTFRHIDQLASQYVSKLIERIGREMNGSVQHVTSPEVFALLRVIDRLTPSHVQVLHALAIELGQPVVKDDKRKVTQR